MLIQKHIANTTKKSSGANTYKIPQLQSQVLKTVNSLVLPEELQTAQPILVQWVEELITAGWGHRQKQKKNRSKNKLPKDPRQRKEAQKKRKK